MKDNNDAANAAKTPQPSSPVQSQEGSLTTSLPTLHGKPPPGMEGFFAGAPPGHVPEFAPLPAPRERCPFSGGSRTWLLEHGEAGDFKLVRVRQRGKLRGKVLIHVPSLLAWLRREMEQQHGAGIEARTNEEARRGIE